MEILEIFFTAINSHVGDILTGSFLLFLAITIASVFVKNKQEYDAIVSDLYTDKRKATPPAIAVNTPQDDSQYYIYNEEEFDDQTQYLLDDGYDIENQRDIKKEAAEWEDITVEKLRGKHNEHITHKLQEIQQMHKITAMQRQKQTERDIGKEITEMMQERGKMDATLNLQKNKTLGVNSSQSHNKFKKLAEKGKLKPDKHTTVGKKLAKEQTHKLHAHKEVKHANHTEQTSEIEEQRKGLKYFR